MGVRSHMASKYLAGKLLHIRISIGRGEGKNISQEELISRLSVHDKRIKKFLVKQNISSYETGYRVPPPPVLLAYARLAGVCMEVLVDDKLELPDRLPVQPGHKAHS